jgi:hypothetical protein
MGCTLILLPKIIVHVKMKTHGFVHLNWFCTWLMDCFNPSFTSGFYDFTLITSSLLRKSSYEYDIFSTLPNLHCGFYIFFCFATSFILVLSLILFLFAYELKLVYLIILSISIIFNVLNILSWFWLLWSIYILNLFITTLDIFVSYYTFGV